MHRETRIAAKRRYIRQREQDLLSRVPRMDDEELRWTVRVFADAHDAQHAEIPEPPDGIAFL